MQTYEITFITKENLGEKPFKDALDSFSGNILSISSIGERQFVYPLKKETRGTYTTVLFEVEPAKLADLNRKLSLNEDILRFLIIAKKASVLKAMAEAAEKKTLVDIKPEIVPEKIIEPIEIEKPAEIAAPVEIETAELIAEPEVLPKPKKAAPKAKTATPKVVKEKTMIEKPAIKVEPTPEVSEEDRLKELDKKLDELLKD